MLLFFEDTEDTVAMSLLTIRISFSKELLAKYYVAIDSRGYCR
jgi:hypothetical protein